MNPSDSPSTQPSPASQPSLDPTETTVTPDPALAPTAQTLAAYEFRHAGWTLYRNLTYRALAGLSLQLRVPYSRLQRFTECGSTAWVLRHRQDPARFRFALDCCHDRFCVPCSHARTQIVAENLSRKVANTPHRLLTLTLKSNHDTLEDQITRLFRSFRRLRSRSLWKQRCHGGAVLLELTWNPETTLWHPHLHVILEGLFLPHTFVKSAWLDITGDSSIVDIRLIRNRDHVIRYITKYVTKPVSAKVTRNADALQQAIVALAGRKTLFTFGTWSRWKLLDPHDSHEWTLYSHAASLDFGLPRDEALNALIRQHYDDWARGSGPAEVTIRAPPAEQPHDYDEW